MQKYKNAIKVIVGYLRGEKISPEELEDTFRYLKANHPESLGALISAYTGEKPLAEACLKFQENLDIIAEMSARDFAPNKSDVKNAINSITSSNDKHYPFFGHMLQCAPGTFTTLSR